MSHLNLMAPTALHTWRTRGGTVSSDANGIIEGVPAGSQLLADLLTAGCYVLPAAALWGTQTATTEDGT
jgi:hypothetical protein